MAKGWVREPRRHSLASKGIKTKVDKPISRVMKKSDDDYDTVYTGTSTIGGVSILQEGLKTSKQLESEMPPFMKEYISMSDQTDSDYTYFFKDPKHAKTWADVVSQRTGSKPMVLEVKVPKKDLIRDFNMPFGEAYKKKGGVSRDNIKKYEGDAV